MLKNPDEMNAMKERIGKSKERIEPGKKEEDTAKHTIRVINDEGEVILFTRALTRN